MLVESLINVLKEIEVMSEQEQNNYAILLNEEIKWAKSFANSQALLSKLGQKALMEFRSGKTKPVVCE